MVYYLGIFISITIRTIRSKVQYTHLAALSHNPDHAPLGYLSSVKNLTLPMPKYRWVLNTLALGLFYHHLASACHV